jgi:hypothetical protein
MKKTSPKPEPVAPYVNPRSRAHNECLNVLLDVQDQIKELKYSGLASVAAYETATAQLKAALAALKGQ